jgi:tetratricopeptide (TPR) repeat protein
MLNKMHLFYWMDLTLLLFNIISEQDNFVRSQYLKISIFTLACFLFFVFQTDASGANAKKGKSSSSNLGTYSNALAVDSNPRIANSSKSDSKELKFAISKSKSSVLNASLRNLPKADFIETKPSVLHQAKNAFDKKEYSTALTLYQNALRNRAAQQKQISSATHANGKNQSLTQKVLSFIKGEPTLIPETNPVNPNSKNIMDGYLYLQMGKCYVQLNKLDKAVSVFDAGSSASGDNDTGNACLFEKGTCHMHNLDYQNAYQSLKEYVRRNVDKDPKEMDQNQMKRALYMASVCAWKLSKSGVSFENNMEDAKTLAKKAYTLLPLLDNRIYFKKKK